MKKEETLYLPIKQVYFNEIIAGTKKCEYREVKTTTAAKYLLRDEDKIPVLNPECTDPNTEYFIDDYNNGNFPFMPIPYKYLSLAVGYAKERDTCIVEVTGYSFEPQMIQADLYAFWVIVYHLGKVIEVHRK